MFFSNFLSLGLAATFVAAQESWIVPGAVWYDTDGNKIDAHGGGVIQQNDTFYWTGHSISNGVTPIIYSSTDLVNWQNLGTQAPEVWSIWRPKSAMPDGQFWIYGQQNREVLSLTSDQLIGEYSTVDSTLLPPDDLDYSDTGMFYDPNDSTWYLLTSADHNIVQINAINSDGTIGDRVTEFAEGEWEAPGVFVADGLYFLILSDKTGYRSNPNKVWWADSLAGPWTGGTDIAPPEENTYNSQNTHELTIEGSEQTTYIYMGDAWDDDGGENSNYVWLPMIVDTSNPSVTLDYHEMWSIDPLTGVVSTPSTRTRYEAEQGRLSGRSTITECSHCISKRAVHDIRSGSEVTFDNVSGSGSSEWVSFHYTVNDPTAGEAYVIVNDEPINLSALNSRAGHHPTVPVKLSLLPGDVNSVTFGAVGTDDFEVFFDGIEFYEA
ncbi:hypothetical protein FQN54_001793 [Arachnomyces sp. PD_36]|nr:hypothetical protein FQN54_001793 [Arachnomyces sp. PD_36]